MNKELGVGKSFENEPLGILMDEALQAVPNVAFVRWKCRVDEQEQITAGLILCAAKGSAFYDRAIAENPIVKKVPAVQMRERTIDSAFKQAALRKHDIACYTSDPDLYIIATINPPTIDCLENSMSDTKLQEAVK